MRTIIRLHLLALFFIVQGAAFLAAFGFEPISATFAPEGPRSNQIFRVSNSENRRIAVKISLERRIMDENGLENNEPAPGLFQVYPARLLLNPGDVRSVRVKWIGDSEPGGELAFRIIAEQIPVDFDPQQRTEGGGIRLTYRYEGSLYILPPHAEPEVVLESYERRGDGLELLFANRGTRHTLLRDLKLRFLPVGEPENREPVTMEGDSLQGIRGENLLAGSRRRFLLPMKDRLSQELLDRLLQGRWEVDFAFDPLF